MYNGPWNCADESAMLAACCFGRAGTSFRSLDSEIERLRVCLRRCNNEVGRNSMPCRPDVGRPHAGLPACAWERGYVSGWESGEWAV